MPVLLLVTLRVLLRVDAWWGALECDDWAQPEIIVAEAHDDEEDEEKEEASEELSNRLPHVPLPPPPTAHKRTGRSQAFNCQSGAHRYNCTAGFYYLHQTPS